MNQRRRALDLLGARIGTRSQPCRAALVLFVALLGGCVDAGTAIVYDPATKALTFERSWLDGPVEFSGRADFPDGTHVEWSWKSEIDLDPAATVRAAEIAALQRALELAAEAAKKAGGAP